MRVLPLSRGALLCFSLSLALSVSFSFADDKTVEVVGVGECADCAQNNFEPKQAFSGLLVTIDCKAADGHFKTRGSGKLDEDGKFKVSLPKDILKEEGDLNEDCYAQLHSSSSAPCPSHDGLESSKIVSQSKTNEKQTFGLPGKLKFSPVTCASEFFWHHFHKHPFFHGSPPKAPEPKKEPPKKEEKPKPKPNPEPKPNPKPAPKKEYCPPKKGKPSLPPPVPVKKPDLPPPVPKSEHPFFKHPFFKHLPPFPPHHPLFPPFPEIHHKDFDHSGFGHSPSMPSLEPHHP